MTMQRKDLLERMNERLRKRNSKKALLELASAAIAKRGRCEKIGDKKKAAVWRKMTKYINKMISIR